MKKKALLSVSDKEGILELAETLVKKDFEILSTGGTAALLKEKKIPVTLIENYTGFPEILDGRVKTLQPKIHAGILANRKINSHKTQMERLEFGLIDIVVVNLYPFEATVSKPGVTLEEAIENIDIGGITLIRAAAKNYESVAIISDIKDYKTVQDALEKDSSVSLEIRKIFALKAFQKTVEYDLAIHKYLVKNIK
ncbi:MAG: hypothetical protein A2Y41_08110 [Spirochaetes bacterium GWB1_36_13]|nr:MAG: hypothetical protein A2Y41_08110 [Spirochaetes bacterium GWB1_36_13]